ncbi:PI-PLC X domain-containing protein [Capsicum annuum]|nr:PI-PLC X domain-containing protein [Capsicum annuum]
MVKKNYRLLVFTSDSSKEAAEGIAYQWRYMVENERKCVPVLEILVFWVGSLAIICGNNVSAGDPGVAPGSCSSRKESKPLNSRSASLFLMNYFPTVAVQNGACKEHSTQLVDTAAACYKAAGNMMPNYVAVNFYMRSDGGGVFDVLDQMNGRTLCGCPTVTACQAGVHFGVCKNITAANAAPTATNTGGMFSGIPLGSICRAGLIVRRPIKQSTVTLMPHALIDSSYELERTLQKFLGL